MLQAAIAVPTLQLVVLSIFYKTSPCISANFQPKLVSMMTIFVSPTHSNSRFGKGMMVNCLVMSGIARITQLADDRPLNGQVDTRYLAQINVVDLLGGKELPGVVEIDPFADEDIE